MNEERAREILGHVIGSSEGLTDLFSYDANGVGNYVDLMVSEGAEKITLNGNFTVEYLEAITWWMRNKANAEKHLAESGTPV